MQLKQLARFLVPLTLLILLGILLLPSNPAQALGVTTNLAASPNAWPSGEQAPAFKEFDSLNNSAPKAAQANENLELIGQIGGRTNAVAVDGDMAYFGMGPRLVIVDISDPANLQVLGQTDVLPSLIRDVVVADSYAYVAVGTSGLRIIDVSTPAAPSEVGFYDTPSYAQGVTVAGSYAYVADGYSGLRIIDVSTPAAPNEAGFLDTPGYANGVTVAGRYAYVADYFDGLRIIDVSTPAAPNEVGFLDTPGDAWGVAVVGSYAYVADASSGLRIIDVSTPAAPNEVGFLDTPGQAWDVVVAGSYAYVAHASSGLRIIDVSTPTAPSQVGFYNAPAHAWGVTVAGSYAYVANGGSGLRIIDVSTPAAPSEVGFYDRPGHASAVIVAGSYAYVADGASLRIIDVSTPAAPSEVGFYDTPGYAYDVAVAGNYAYVAAGTSGLRIIDVSTPAAPSEVGFVNTPGRAGGVAIAGSYAYVTDFSGGLRIIDVSAPAAPSEVGFYDTEGLAWDVAVAGSYAYVADGSSGLRIIDVSTPAAPSEVGFVDTPGLAQDVDVAGRYAYVADRTSGLRIIDVSTPATPSEVGFYDTLGYAYSVAIAGRYAYVADDFSGLRIIDVSTPAAPSEVGFFYDTALGVAMDVAVSCRYAYVASHDNGLVILEFGDPNASACIQGMKFHDINGNGLRDAGESGLGGVTIELTDANGNLLATTTTVGDGSYLFSGLPAGSYTVSEVVPNGWQPTTPASVTVQASPGGTATASFGNAYSGIISGIKFHDQNGNGYQDFHESGIGGVTIELADAEGNPVGTTTTAANGSFSFDSLSPGNYTVSEVVPDGWQPTTPASVTVQVSPGGSATASFGNAEAIPANRIRYDIGSTYTYRSQLAVVSESEFQDTGGTRIDETTVDINTLVDLTAVGLVGEDYLLQIEVYSTQITQTGQQEIITDTSQSPLGNELTKPFFVIQKPNGEVTDVLSSDDDSIISSNLKKGFASNIQLYLPDDDAPYTVVVTDTSGVYQADYDTTVAGNTLQLVKDTTEDDYLELLGGQSMDENMRLTSTSTIEFDRHQGVVTYVLSQEDASFSSPDEPTPPGDESFNFQMNTDGNGTMRLIEVTPNQDSPALPSGTLEEQKQALEQALEVSLTVTNLIAESLPEEFITDGDPAAIDEALEALNTEPTNPSLLSGLVDAIQSDAQGVQMIATRLQNGGISTDSQATVASALSAVGSDEAQNLLLDEFLLRNEAELTEQEHVLVLLSMQLEPTERVLDVTEGLRNDGSSELSEQATLVLGALAYTISDTNPARTAQIVQVFEAQLDEATETSQVELYLMAVGNAGQNNSIPVVEPYLNHESPLIRARAVEALRKMSSTEVESLLRSQFEKDQNKTVRATIVEVQNERGTANTNHQSRAMAHIIDWSWSKTYGANNLNATLGARVEADGAPFYFSAKGYAKAKAWGYQPTLAQAQLLSEPVGNKQKFGAYLSVLNNSLLTKEVSINCGGSGSGTLVDKSYVFFHKTSPPIPVFKILTLSFTAKVSGHVKVPYTYAYDLCSTTNTHAEGTITPRVWVHADGYATLNAWLVRGGLGVKADLLNTAVPLSASIDLTNAKFTFCYSADLEFQAVNGQLYVWGQARNWRLKWGKRHEGAIWRFNTPNDVRTLISRCPWYYLPPDLTIDKTHVGDFEKGGVGRYSIQVSNLGGPTTAQIVVTDVLPSSLTYQSASGNSWSCTASGATVTCTHSGPLAHQTSSSLLMDVGLDNSATIQNCAEVNTNGEHNLANNEDCDDVSLIDPIILVLDPPAITTGVDETFELPIEVRADTQEVDGASAHLNFDPTYLEVVSITPGSDFSTEILNQFDNDNGQLDFAAGSFEDFPSGTFTLATVTFRSKALTPSGEDGTPVDFNLTFPRLSDATSSGASVLSHTEGSTIFIENATLEGAVTLQGRPAPPDSRWVVPLRVSFTVVGESTPAYEFEPTTDQNGHFTLEGIEPGTYEVRVKHSHTLQNKQTVTVVGGDNGLIDFGTLREGDANDDNYVTLVDFSILVSTFAKCEADADYDEPADFNGDTCVTILDFSLLASNFAQEGQHTPEGGAQESPPGNASLYIDQPIIQASAGNSYLVTVRLEADTPVDGAAAYIDFDQSLLKVNSIRSGEAFDLELQRQFDNQTGSINFAAGTLESPQTGNFDLLLIELEAIGNGESPILFGFDAPRTTDVTSSGQSVLSDYVDGSNADIPTAVEVAQIETRGGSVAMGWMALLVMGALLVVGVGRRWIVRR